MTSPLKRLRGVAKTVGHRLRPTPEVAAYRRAWHRAQDVGRHVPGSIRMMEYDLQYADLMSLCPQWQDIFVDGALEFRPASATPRILDCGANVGLASLFLKRRHPGARITAYEADPELFYMLKTNLAANGAGDIEVVHAALWTRTGRVKFQADGSDSGAIEGLAGTNGGRTLGVPGMRLRDILAAESIDLLKLDIEGAEEAVLADCAPVLDRVRAMVLDVHEFDPNHRQAPRVLDRLTSCGFTYAVDELVAQRWRPPVASTDSPFPDRALVWSMTVRAWRE
jgi:FkbM family methyltransferase